MKILVVTLIALAAAILSDRAQAQVGVSPDNAGYSTSAEKAARLRDQVAVTARSEMVVEVGAVDETSPQATSATLGTVVLRNLEQHAGAEPGALSLRNNMLTLDVAKSFKAATGARGDPFGLVLSHPTSKSVAVGAKSEYRTDISPGRTETVATISAPAAALASRVAETGEAPVSINIPAADLTATQQMADGPNLPVTVRVGTDTRVLQPGETSRFGLLDVEILFSTNLSASPPGTLETPPFGLAVRVRGASPLP